MSFCLQEDLGEHVVQGEIQTEHMGTACLLSSTFLESGKDNGVVTLPIMGRNSRRTIGKVRGKDSHPYFITLPRNSGTYICPSLSKISQNIRDGFG